LFYADAVVATIDQIITSYACAPLSLGVRHGNIPAGAVTTSFLVFDEVHTLDPERALQSVFFIARRLRQAKVPFMIMTATLPETARHLLCQRLGLTQVGVEEALVPVRAQRRVTLQLALDRPLTAGEVREALKASAGRILVVCNTVDRAVSLYRSLRDAALSPFLLHSRFLDDDRRARDQRMRELLGRDAQKPCIVIATQVVEVGLDISCDVLLAELSPIDSLLQRAGRCVRWAEAPGRVRVYGLPLGDGREATAPYNAAIVKDTARALEMANGDMLTWELEQRLVDQVLGERYAEWLEPAKAARAARKLADAVFTGDRRAAEEAVREPDSVEVSLHTQPAHLKGRLRFLPRISVSAGLVRRFAREAPDSVWSLEVDRKLAGDESRVAEALEPVRTPKDIRFGHYYILSSNVSYSSDEGLVFDGPGMDWEPQRREYPGRLANRGPLLETLEQHTMRVLEQFRARVRFKEGYALSRAGLLVERDPAEIERLLTIVSICHDLGKASEAWQRAAWDAVALWLKEDPANVGRLSEDERELLNADRRRTFLARFPSLMDRSLEPPRPSHATVSAYIVWDWLKRDWGNWGEAAAMAMAHHHSVRASEVPHYRLKEGWLELLTRLMEAQENVQFDLSHLRIEQRSVTKLPLTMPPFHQEKPYTLYIVLSRCLSLADRMAAGGGEDAILDYEEWARNL